MKLTGWPSSILRGLEDSEAIRCQMCFKWHVSSQIGCGSQTSKETYGEKKKTTFAEIQRFNLHSDVTLMFLVYIPRC